MLVSHTRIVDIVGDIIRIQVSSTKSESEGRPCLGDLALVDAGDGMTSLAQVINIDHDMVSLQVNSGTKGLANNASVRFLGEAAKVTYSDNILGRVFHGAGHPID